MDSDKVFFLFFSPLYGPRLLASVQNRSSRCCHFKQKQATRDPPHLPFSLRAPLPISGNPSQGLANKSILCRAGRKALGAFCLLLLQLVSPCWIFSFGGCLPRRPAVTAVGWGVGGGGFNITMQRQKKKEQKAEL